MKKNISPEEDIKYGKKTIIFNIFCVVLVIATALIQHTFSWGEALFLALFLGNIWWG